MLTMIFVFGFGLPILGAWLVSRLPITSPSDRSTVLWIVVAPAAIGGMILGGVLGQFLGLS